MRFIVCEIGAAGIRPQVALLTRGARGPASPSSPFASLKLGYGCGFRIPSEAKQFASSASDI